MWEIPIEYLMNRHWLLTNEESAMPVFFTQSLRTALHNISWPFSSSGSKKGDGRQRGIINWNLRLLSGWQSMSCFALGMGTVYLGVCYLQIYANVKRQAGQVTCKCK